MEQTKSENRESINSEISNENEKTIDNEIPIFPLFDLQFVEIDNVIYLLGAGGGGDPEFGKRNGIILFVRNSNKKSRDVFIEKMYYETENIVKKIYAFKKNHKMYLLLETEPLLYILSLNNELKFENLGNLNNENIFSFEENLYLRTGQNILSINYEKELKTLDTKTQKKYVKDDVIFFNFKENICVIKKLSHYLITINKKIYKTDKEIIHIYGFGKVLFCVLKESVLYLTEIKQEELLIKFCTKISLNFDNYTFSSADGHVYIYHKDSKDELKIFWLKKVYGLAIIAADYNSTEHILTYSSYDCTLAFTKVGYQKKFVVIFVFLILWIFGLFFLLKRN